MTTAVKITALLPNTEYAARCHSSSTPEQRRHCEGKVRVSDVAVDVVNNGADATCAPHHQRQQVSQRPLVRSLHPPSQALATNEAATALSSPSAADAATSRDGSSLLLFTPAPPSSALEPRPFRDDATDIRLKRSESPSTMPATSMPATSRPSSPPAKSVDVCAGGGVCSILEAGVHAVGGLAGGRSGTAANEMMAISATNDFLPVADPLSAIHGDGNALASSTISVNDRKQGTRASASEHTCAAVVSASCTTPCGATDAHHRQEEAGPHPGFNTATAALAAPAAENTAAGTDKRGPLTSSALPWCPSPTSSSSNSTITTSSDLFLSSMGQAATVAAEEAAPTTPSTTSFSVLFPFPASPVCPSATSSSVSTPSDDSPTPSAPWLVQEALSVKAAVDEAVRGMADSGSIDEKWGREDGGILEVPHVVGQTQEEGGVPGRTRDLSAISRSVVAKVRVGACAGACCCTVVCYVTSWGFAARPTGTCFCQSVKNGSFAIFSSRSVPASPEGLHR